MLLLRIQRPPGAASHLVGPQRHGVLFCRPDAANSHHEIARTKRGRLLQPLAGHTHGRPTAVVEMEAARQAGAAALTNRAAEPCTSQRRHAWELEQGRRGRRTSQSCKIGARQLDGKVGAHCPMRRLLAVGRRLVLVHGCSDKSSRG